MAPRTRAGTVERAASAPFDPFVELRGELREVWEDLDELRFRLTRRFWVFPPITPRRRLRAAPRSPRVRDLGAAYEVVVNLPAGDRFDLQVDTRQLLVHRPPPPLRARGGRNAARSSLAAAPTVVDFPLPVDGDRVTVRVDGDHLRLLVPKRDPTPDRSRATRG